MFVRKTEDKSSRINVQYRYDTAFIYSVYNGVFGELGVCGVPALGRRVLGEPNSSGATEEAGLRPDCEEPPRAGDMLVIIWLGYIICCSSGAYGRAAMPAVPPAAIAAVVALEAGTTRLLRWLRLLPEGVGNGRGRVLAADMDSSKRL